VVNRNSEFRKQNAEWFSGILNSSFSISKFSRDLIATDPASVGPDWPLIRRFKNKPICFRCAAASRRHSERKE